MRTLLGHRRARRELYEDGAYQPLAATGTRAEHLLAFQRRVNGHALVVVVPVLFARLIDADGATAWPIGAATWRDAAIPVAGSRHWRDLFTGARLEAGEHDGGFALAAADALARLPVACLEPAD